MVKKGENIYKRKDGRWEGRYIKERTPQNKIVYGYIYGRQYSEVKEKLTVVKAKYLTTDYTITSYSGTIEQFIGNWMMTTMKYTVKPTTYSNYVRLIKRHILPSIGSIRLQKIKQEEIQSLVYQLAKEQFASGTIRNVFNILKNALNVAVKQNYLHENPCKNVILPKTTTKKITALSLSDQRRIELLALKEMECSPILLALYSGMRIGEISGLKWEDIDFEKNVIHVRRTITRITNEHTSLSKTEIVAGTPKSNNSERVIPLAANLSNYLLNKKNETSTAYVISCNGGLAEPRTINYRFKKITNALGLSDIRFHTLRHTFATRCLEQGVDIASLSQILGHHSTKLTLDTYTDSLLENRQAAIATIDHLFLNAQ
ncbi:MULTISPECIES: tyrosine-type recombinase/integrase [unclassified Enterococcus]|uniref:tyrosine-type recombinase/integrase n=1 Tax=unclassified Enterococcus TaxID=2608891 RepID=UPI001CE1191D|nr:MULTISPECIES: site-specific integrase [unclassified Enterococcus]MCA5013652.1 site-specific integrase [Enterococcus sp. S23]MCA5016902.1 site-specific integrase [Enterococcus sp. S22(2020)]